MEYPQEITRWIQQAEQLSLDAKQAERASYAAREAYREAGEAARALAGLGTAPQWVERDTNRELRSLRKSALLCGVLAVACGAYFAIRLLLGLPFGPDPVSVTHNPNVAAAGAGADLGAAAALAVLFLAVAVFRGRQYRSLCRKRNL